MNKYSQEANPLGLTGKEIAEKMLKDNGIYDVQVISTPGQLTDHYNPQDKTVNLSELVYASNSITAAAVSLPHDNVNIQWSGFSDSLPTFVEETLKRIKGLRVHDMPDTFAQVKEKLM